MTRLNFLRDINHLLISLSFSLVLSLPQDYLNIRGHVRANVMQVKELGALTAVVIVMAAAQLQRLLSLRSLNLDLKSMSEQNHTILAKQKCFCR